MEDQALAEFASPFKRRRAALLNKAGPADGFQSPPPAARKLGRFFTPQGKAAPAPAGPAAPATPGADLRARAATESRGRDTFCPDGPAGEEGLLSPEPDPLPPQLALLRDLLGALYATLPLVKARGQLTTLPNLRGPVQNLSGRDLRPAHLQQIKALYPDAFSWQHVLVAAGRSGRQEEQLLLGLISPERLQQQQHKQQQEHEEEAERPGQQQGRGGSTPSRRAAAVTPKKQGAGGCGGGAATPGRREAVGCSASVHGTMQQQREFLRLLRARVAAGKVEAAEDLPLAPLPGPAPPSARDGTPSRRQASGALGAAAAADALPRTPQTGASGRAAMSPIGAATPGTDGTVRSLAFSPLPTSKLPVPRFAAAATAASPACPPGAATPGTPGTKRTAAGLELQRAPSGAAAAATAGLLSPRGGGGARPGAEGGAGMRPSRLCFDSVAAPAAQRRAGAAGQQQRAEQEEEQGEECARAAAAAAPRVRRLSFDAPAAAPASAGGAAGGAPAPAPAAAPATREGGGSGPGRQLSGGLKFELKASTMALLDRAASAQVRVEQARQAAELSARHHLDLAAATFEVLRRVFGDKGACAMPQEQVVAQIRARSTSKSGLSPDDAAEQLRLMLRMLPAWIRLDHPQGVALADMKAVVRIHRRTPWGELRGQLLSRVAESRAAGAAAAARGADAEAAAAAEAADLARAAADAAAARAGDAAARAAGDAPRDGPGASEGADAGGSGQEEGAEQAGGAGDDGGGHGEERLEGDGKDGSETGAGGRAVPKPEALAACLKARVWGRKG